MSPSMISKPWYRQSVTFRRLGHALSRGSPRQQSPCLAFMFLCRRRPPLPASWTDSGLLQARKWGGQIGCLRSTPPGKGQLQLGRDAEPHLGTVQPPPAGPLASQGTTATIMKANSGSDSDCVHFTRPLEGGVQGLHVQWGPAEEDRNRHASFRASPLTNRAPGGQSPVPARIRGSECGRVQAPLLTFQNSLPGVCQAQLERWLTQPTWGTLTQNTGCRGWCQSTWALFLRWLQGVATRRALPCPHPMQRMPLGQLQASPAAKNSPSLQPESINTIIFSTQASAQIDKGNHGDFPSLPRADCPRGKEELFEQDWRPWISHCNSKHFPELGQAGPRCQPGRGATLTLFFHILWHLNHTFLNSEKTKWVTM